MSNKLSNIIILSAIFITFIIGIILFNCNCVSCNIGWSSKKQSFGCANGNIIQAKTINYYCETGEFCTNSVANQFCWRCSVLIQYQNMNNISCIISETGYNQDKLIDKLKTKFPENITNIIYVKADNILNCSDDNNFPISISCVIGLILLVLGVMETFIVLIFICVLYYKKIKKEKEIEIEIVDVKINLENIKESDKLIENEKKELKK